MVAIEDDDVAGKSDVCGIRMGESKIINDINSDGIASKIDVCGFESKNERLQIIILMI